MIKKFLKHITLLLMVVSIISLTACSGNRAEELYKTAQFEEVQSNRKHAKQLYLQILKEYPASEYARKAEARLLVMGN